MDNKTKIYMMARDSLTFVLFGGLYVFVAFPPSSQLESMNVD